MKSKYKIGDTLLMYYGPFEIIEALVTHKFLWWYKIKYDYFNLENKHIWVFNPSYAVKENNSLSFIMD